jgi:hypothetical protein
MIKIPKTPEESAIAIAELQAKTDWIQGQANLLLGFIAASPEQLSLFAKFAKSMSERTEEMNKDARAVALALIDAGLYKLAEQIQSPPSDPEPSGEKPYRGSNVIQFPGVPRIDPKK